MGHLDSYWLLFTPQQPSSGARMPRAVPHDAKNPVNYFAKAGLFEHGVRASELGGRAGNHTSCSHSPVSAVKTPASAIPVHRAAPRCTKSLVAGDY